MNDLEKAQLRAEVKEMIKRGVLRKTAVSRLVKSGWNRTTASRYWRALSNKGGLK